MSPCHCDDYGYYNIGRIFLMSYGTRFHPNKLVNSYPIFHTVSDAFLFAEIDRFSQIQHSDSGALIRSRIFRICWSQGISSTPNILWTLSLPLRLCICLWYPKNDWLCMKNMENADSIASLTLDFVALLSLLGSFIFSIASCEKSKKTLKTKIVGYLNWLELLFSLYFKLYLCLVTYICIICCFLNLKLL